MEKWKSVPLDGYKYYNIYTVGDAFSNMINYLEGQSIKHPDFAKAKELLKKK